MKLLVISPTAHPPHAERMIATARRVDIEPELYGLTSNHPHGKDYQGTDIVRILKARTDAEYVMGVDAPDVAFLAGEAEILSTLAKFDHPFVVSAELEGVSGLRRTKEELFRQCQAAGGYHAQLNIGCWIGRRDYALECFTEAERLYKDHPEDPTYSYDNHFQYLALMKAWGHAADGPAGLVGLGGPEFHVDTHCRIFQSMNQASTQWMPVSRRIHNAATGSWPCVLHYNGDPTRGAYGEMVERILEC